MAVWMANALHQLAPAQDILDRNYIHLLQSQVPVIVHVGSLKYNRAIVNAFSNLWWSRKSNVCCEKRCWITDLLFLTRTQSVKVTTNFIQKDLKCNHETKLVICAISKLVWSIIVFTFFMSVSSLWISLYFAHLETANELCQLCDVVWGLWLNSSFQILPQMIDCIQVCTLTWLLHSINILY